MQYQKELKDCRHSAPSIQSNPLVKYSGENNADHIPDMDLEEINFFINETEKDSSDDGWEMGGTGKEIHNAFDIFEEDEGDDE